MPIIKDMRENFINFTKDKKYAVLLILFFLLACLKLCASSKKMSPEEAKEARTKVVEEAKTYVGAPYVHGAAGPSSFDCSGFTYYVYRTILKIQLPRTASAVYDYCDPIKDNEMEPGDLVFFKTTSSKKISHVGIYLGNGNFISAISDGNNTGVQIRTLLKGYWADTYTCAARVIPSGLIISDEPEDKDREVEPREAEKTKGKSYTVTPVPQNGNKTRTVEPRDEPKAQPKTETRKSSRKQEAVQNCACTFATDLCTQAFCSGI